MSIYLEDSKAPVDNEVTAFDLEVTGEIPKQLEGRWLRNGPNPFGSVDSEDYHWFLGDGMIHGVRLREGKAELSVLAFFILFTISSFLSVKLILLKSEGSDLLIFFVPSFKLIILAKFF